MTDIEDTIIAEVGDYRLRLEYDLDPLNPVTEYGEEFASSEDIVAYTNGDVFGYIIERRAVTRTTWVATDGEVLDFGDPVEGWMELDSCWGFYGERWARISAHQALVDMVGKCIRCLSGQPAETHNCAIVPLGSSEDTYLNR